MKDFASSYGMSASAMVKVIDRVSWQHVPCETCGSVDRYHIGIGCKTLKKKFRTESTITHVRPFFDELDEPVWVAIFSDKPPRLSRVPIYGKRTIGTMFIGIDDEYRPNPKMCCPKCMAEEPCEAWTAEPGDGYERRKPHERFRLTAEQKAARDLGVEWPCTEEQLTIAFRDATAKAHPDHGGTDEQMKRVIEAREMLAAAGAQR
jgi:hypothetical protein